MSLFLRISARDIRSKTLAIWFPTATFAALAMDHVTANMFLVPIGICNGAPFCVGYHIWKSLILETLGMIIGGGLFVGAIYWYLYLTGQGDFQVFFNTGALQSTIVEDSGPMARDDATKIASPSCVGRMVSDHLPHSGGPLQSYLGWELAAEKYGKRNASDESETTAV